MLPSANEKILSNTKAFRLIEWFPDKPRKKVNPNHSKEEYKKNTEHGPLVFIKEGEVGACHYEIA